MSSYRNRVLKLSSSYRNPMVKHEPELQAAFNYDHRKSRAGIRMALFPAAGEKGPLTREFSGADDGNRTRTVSLGS
jgi:hypothetical protein